MRVNELASILLVIGIIFLGIAAAGGLKNLGDPIQRCIAYKTWHAEWVIQGKPGGREEEERVARFYGIVKPVCAARGVPI